MKLTIHTGLLLATTLLAFGPCGTLSNQNSTDMTTPSLEEVPFTSIAQGDTGWQPSGWDGSPQFVLVRTPSQWKGLKAHFSFDPAAIGADRADQLDQIDFGQQSILIYTMGLVGNTGHTIELERLMANGEMVSYLQVTGPDPDEDVGEVEGHPFHLVIVNRTAFPEAFTFVVNGKPAEYHIHREE